MGTKLGECQRAAGGPAGVPRGHAAEAEVRGVTEMRETEWEHPKIKCESRLYLSDKCVCVRTGTSGLSSLASISSSLKGRRHPGLAQLKGPSLGLTETAALVRPGGSGTPCAWGGLRGPGASHPPLLTPEPAAGQGRMVWGLPSENEAVILPASASEASCNL